MRRDTDVFVPSGASRLWPFAVQADLPDDVPRWKPHVFIWKSVFHNLLGIPAAKPAAIDFWRNSPNEWLRTFMGAEGAGTENPSRHFVASLILPGDSVLDAGCGTGVDYEVLAAADKASGYVGIDVTEPVVDIARESHPGGDFRIGNIADLERQFGPRSFDVVLMRHVLEHQSDFEVPMRQAIAVSRRLAIFVFYLTPRRLPFGVRVVDPRQDMPFYVNIYSRPKINQYLARSGLRRRWHDYIGASRTGWLTGETNCVLTVSRYALPLAQQRRSMRLKVPQIVMIVGHPNWAHDYKAGSLQRLLGNEYQIVKRYGSEVTAADLEPADLILVYFWLQFQQMGALEAAFVRHRHKLLIGISSHAEFEGERREPGLAVLRKLAQGVFANSRLLFNEFQPLLNAPMFYTPNGVDTDFFCPGPTAHKAPPLRVGWAGSLSNHGPEQRGFYDLIVPAINSLEGVELVTAIREEQWRSREQMLEFYQSLDVYLCASRNEGTPNPCLEAAACGVPVVTTRVGNMPELIRHGVNGLFVGRDVADIATKIGWLRDQPEARARLGQSLLASIQAWDWRCQADNYRRMFSEYLDCG